MVEQVFIIHHTHVDLGYTGPRQQMCGQLTNMVGEVSDAIKRNSSRPAPERFRWVHEVSWPVLESFKQNHNEQIIKHMREGYAELTAFYLNPTELFDKDEFEYSTLMTFDFAKRHSIDIKTAMFCDCPGISWAVIDILIDKGVRYLLTAPNFIMSFPLDVERPFYWESPTGKRLLTWFTEWRNYWYSEGLWGLGLTEDGDTPCEKLNKYIKDIESGGYKWKGLAINAAMDNEGPQESLCDFVKRYNSRHDSIKVRLATAREFFEYMETMHGSEFPVVRGAWPDWWVNGLCSAAYEVSVSRRVKNILRRSKKMAESFGLEINPAVLNEAYKEILLFDEHTWGSSKSVLVPWAPDVRLEWNEKRSHVLRALVSAEALEKELSQQISGKSNITMINPFDTDIAGVVFVKGVKDSYGTRRIDTVQSIPSQEVVDDDGHSGVCMYIEVSKESRCVDIEPCEQQLYVQTDENLSNSWFTIKYNKEKRVEYVFDKSREVDLFDARSQYGILELIHETVDGGREAIYDISNGPNEPESKIRGSSFIRTCPLFSSNPFFIKGPVFNSILNEGKLPNLQFKREIRLYHQLPYLEVLLEIDKQISTEYESIYLSMPFIASNPVYHVEKCGTVFNPGKEQLPGSAVDWYCADDYLAITDDNGTILIYSHDAPVFQIGDINTGKWQHEFYVNNGLIYYWLMNNLWFTNFPSYQGGRVKMRWSIVTHKGKFDRGLADQLADKIQRGIVVFNKLDINAPIEWGKN